MRGVVLFLAAAVAALSVLVAIQLHEAGKTHDAICSYRNNLANNAAKTQRLLDDHPWAKLIDLDPSPSAKLLVARTTLVNGVRRQQQAVASFDRSGISCK